MFYNLELLYRDFFSGNGKLKLKPKKKPAASVGKIPQYASKADEE